MKMHFAPKGAAIAVSVLLLAGYSAGGSSKPSELSPGLAFRPATNVLVPCPGCFEPAVAVDPQGRIFVAAQRLGGGPSFGVTGFVPAVAHVAVSNNGGRTFTVKPVPDPAGSPSPIANNTGDDVIQTAPWGTVYFTQLWSDTDGSLGAGIHLAASGDGGDTWPINRFIHVREMPTSRSFTADRQWLAFDGDSTVYLVFNCGASAAICVMRSDDRGATWSAARDVVLPIDHNFPSPEGFPTVGPDGALIVPYFADPRPDTCLGARSIRIAASTDGGLTFVQHTVFTHPLDEGTCGGGWPEATILSDNSWVAGWSTSDSRLWLSRSTDRGATWSGPTVLDAEVNGGIDGHPWLLPRTDGGLDAVWFTDGPGVRLGRFSSDLTLLATADVGEAGGGEADYPYFAHLPGDRVVTPFITPGDPDVGLKIAISNK